MDKPLVKQGRDFKNGKSVHDFDFTFRQEDKQRESF